MNKRERVLLLTQDPAARGGVATIAETAVASLVRLGVAFDHVYIASLSFPRVGLIRPAWDPRPYCEDRHGRIALRAVLPETQLMQYWGHSNTLQSLQLTRGWTRVLITGGSVTHGAVSLPLDLPVSVWFGTGLDEERSSQWSTYDPLRRFMHRAVHQRLMRREHDVVAQAAHLAAQSPHGVGILSALAGRAVDLLFPNSQLPRTDAKDSREGRLARHEVHLLFVGRVQDSRKRFASCVRLANVLAVCLGDRWTVILSVTAEPQELGGLGLGNRSGFVMQPLGHISPEALARAYSQAHWLVLTSEQEGLGVVIVEALDQKTPCAVTPCGGPEALVRESGAGLVANVDDLASGIAAIVKAGRWAGFSEAAGNYAHEHLSSDVFDGGLIRLLDLSR